MPVSDSEIIFTHEGNTVAGPFCVKNSVDFKAYFPFDACWNLWYTQDGWLVTDVEVELDVVTWRD